MAKLSARGRTELARWKRVRDHYSVPNGRVREDGTTWTVGDVVWEQEEIAAMSDRKVLVRRVLRWRDGMRHDYGWTVRGKMNPTTTIESLGRVYEKGGYARVP